MTTADRKDSGRRPLIAQYQGKGLLYAFVYRTAQRRVLSELRRRERAAVSIPDEGILAATSGESDQMALDDIRTTLARVMGDLSVRERVVLRMTCDGCSNSEIAERISAPGSPRIHDGRVSHIRNAVVSKIREQLGSLAESQPTASTLISDLLDGMPVQELSR
ncbi:MAG: sigma-70 family RNA polymerase sigma factor [Planctomycetaceae bacterium]|nr:sigma-70 family RNA polymerase sigma factor [Planctomycetaceae bacterium]